MPRSKTINKEHTKTFEMENSPCFLTVMEVFSSASVNGLFSVFSNVSTGIHKISFSCELNEIRIKSNSISIFKILTLESTKSTFPVMTQ